MIIRKHAFAIALVALGVSALAIPFAIPSAQVPTTAAPPQRPDVVRPPAGMTVPMPPQGQMPQPMNPMPPQGPPMMMGGGGTAIASDGSYLYVVQGGEIFKVRKSDLGIEAHGHLHMQMREGMPTLPPPVHRSGGGNK